MVQIWLKKHYIEQGYYARGQVSKEVVSRIANTASEVLSTKKNNISQ